MTTSVTKIYSPTHNILSLCKGRLTPVVLCAFIQDISQDAAFTFMRERESMCVLVLPTFPTLKAQGETGSAYKLPIRASYSGVKVRNPLIQCILHY